MSNDRNITRHREFEGAESGIDTLGNGWISGDKAGWSLVFLLQEPDGLPEAEPFG